MQKILIIIDKPNWAYSSIAEALVKHCPSDLVLHVKSCKNDLNTIKKTSKKYDLYFVMGWQNFEHVNFLDKKRTIVGVHSHQSFDNRQTTPTKDVFPDTKTIDILNSFKKVNTVSERLFRILKKSGVDAIYTKNGVDTDVFYPSERYADRFVVGCAASKKNDWNKGFYSHILPACRKSKVAVNSAMIDQNRVKHGSMPSFYRLIDCYVCASLAEGMSLSVLEAASSGCVIISTSVGDNVRLIQNSYNGIIVDRTVENMARALSLLKSDFSLRNKMSERIRQSVLLEWDWKNNVLEWYGFLRNAQN